MAQLSTGTPEWDVIEDRDLWFQFLRTRTGQRLFAAALENQPPLLGKGDVNEILIRSGEVRGWSACITTLISLSIPETNLTEAAPVESYPELTDDAAWDDKKKTTE